ncbi:hypothetical protein E0198_002409 [Clavispora lusitaniae]|nr:hypothetical protein E0198_002409 [Clavispora lusitaniae]
MSERAKSPISRVLELFGSIPQGTWEDRCDEWLKKGAEIYGKDAPIKLTHLYQRVFIESMNNVLVRMKLYELPPPATVGELVAEARYIVDKLRIPKENLVKRPYFLMPPEDSTTHRRRRNQRKRRNRSYHRKSNRNPKKRLIKNSWIFIELNCSRGKVTTSPNAIRADESFFHT